MNCTAQIHSVRGSEIALLPPPHQHWDWETQSAQSTFFCWQVNIGPQRLQNISSHSLPWQCREYSPNLPVMCALLLYETAWRVHVKAGASWRGHSRLTSRAPPCTFLMPIILSCSKSSSIITASTTIFAKKAFCWEINLELRAVTAHFSSSLLCSLGRKGGTCIRPWKPLLSDSTAMWGWLPLKSALTNLFCIFRAYYQWQMVIAVKDHMCDSF